MPVKSRVHALAFILGALASVEVRGADLEAYLQREALLELSRASNAAELAKTWSSIAVPDPALNLLHACMVSRLQPGDLADRELINMIPQDRLAFWFIYSVTYTEWARTTPLNEIMGGGYFQDVAKAVVRQRAGLKPFLQLSYFADGEVASSLADWTEYVRQKLPDEFSKAYASLPAEVQRRVCVNCESVGK